MTSRERGRASGTDFETLALAFDLVLADYYKAAPRRRRLRAHITYSRGHIQASVKFVGGAGLRSRAYDNRAARLLGRDNAPGDTFIWYVFSRVASCASAAAALSRCDARACSARFLFACVRCDRLRRDRVEGRCSEMRDALCIIFGVTWDLLERLLRGNF